MKKLLFLLMMSMCSFSIFASSPKLEAILGKAQKGNVKAQYQAGWYYANVKHNYSKAIEWLNKAAESYAPAQYYLGWCYYYGVGTERNIDQAMYWYKKASLGKKKDIKKEAGIMLRACESLKNRQI